MTLRIALSALAGCCFIANANAFFTTIEFDSDSTTLLSIAQVEHDSSVSVIAENGVTLDNFVSVDIAPTDSDTSNFAPESYVSFTLSQGAHTCHFDLKGSDLVASGSQISYCCPGFSIQQAGIMTLSGIGMPDDDIDIDEIFGVYPWDAQYRPFTNTCPNT